MGGRVVAPPSGASARKMGGGEGGVHYALRVLAAVLPTRKLRNVTETYPKNHATSIASNSRCTARRRDSAHIGAEPVEPPALAVLRVAGGPRAGGRRARARPECRQRPPRPRPPARPWLRVSAPRRAPGGTRRLLRRWTRPTAARPRGSGPLRAAPRRRPAPPPARSTSSRAPATARGPGSAAGTMGRRNRPASQTERPRGSRSPSKSAQQYLALSALASSRASCANRKPAFSCDCGSPRNARTSYRRRASFVSSAEEGEYGLVEGAGEAEEEDKYRRLLSAARS